MGHATFFWLDSVELAIRRVRIRVQEGHDIPEATIRRRYSRGLENFFRPYRDAVDDWVFADNSEEFYQIIAEGNRIEETVYKETMWSKLKRSII